MAFRISPAAWPALVLSAPIAVPKLMHRNRLFKQNRGLADTRNVERIREACQLDLPELNFVELTVLVDERARDGFRSDPGVSYLVTTNLGSLLFDVGFGPDSATLDHNAEKLDIDFGEVDAVAISHLHADHMGGMSAYRTKSVRVSSRLDDLQGRPCFLPDKARAQVLDAQIVTAPSLLAAGIGTTGPLARSLFFLGLCEEMALVARLRDRGLVVVTGCGHPTVELILEMVRHLSDEPIHAIAGGIHFPVTGSRSQRRGVQTQMFFGTGRPPWQRITDHDLTNTIKHINDAEPRTVLLSAHDTCDHALNRLKEELSAGTNVLEAGATYRL